MDRGSKKRFQDIKKRICDCNLKGLKNFLNKDDINQNPVKIVNLALKQSCNLELMQLIYNIDSNNSNKTVTELAHKYNKQWFEQHDKNHIYGATSPFMMAILRHKKIFDYFLNK